MQARVRNLEPRIFTAVLLCVLGMPSFAADANSEAQWFVNLVKTNSGKTFCAPQTTTLVELATALSKFSKAHPEFRDQLTDIQAIQGLAESYPCTVVATPGLANAPLSEISKSGVKNIEVVPTGQFASIDTKPTIAIMQKLRSTAGHENDALVDQIIKSPGNYMPPTLFALAELLYRQGDIDNAIFWFNAARLRGFFDASLCTDISARSAIPALVQQMPKELIKTQFDDIQKLKITIDRVLKWDEATPYNYDHRWISLHGMKAINSGLGNADQNGPLTAPSERWHDLAKQNRDQYRKSFDEAIDTIQKHRANTSPSQTGKLSDGAAITATPTLVVGNYDVPVKLGDTIAQVRTAYQTAAEPGPVNIPGRPGAKSLLIPNKGTCFFFDQTGNIYTIRLDAPFQGRVAGVKIGDSSEIVLKSLGNPSKRIPMPGLPDAFVYRPDSTFSANIRFNRAEVVETIFVSR
jgi:tetratricopeptide (TPR) repeat protein